MPFTNLATDARDALGALAHAGEDVRPMEMRSFGFHTGALDPVVKPKEFIDEVGEWARGGRFIYLFQAAASHEQLEAMFETYENAKTGKLGDRKYA